MPLLLLMPMNYNLNKVFRMENERPPDNLNITNLFQSVDFNADINLIEKICNNEETLIQHKECKELIEKAADSLGDSKRMTEINDSIFSFNALSHSTFESTTFGIYFNDYNKFETVASPEFLNSLTTWIMLLNFQCSTVIDSKTGSETNL